MFIACFLQKFFCGITINQGNCFGKARIAFLLELSYNEKAVFENCSQLNGDGEAENE